MFEVIRHGVFASVAIFRGSKEACEALVKRIADNPEVFTSHYPRTYEVSEV
jgi:hypothetical protein